MRPLVCITIFVMLLRGGAFHAPPVVVDDAPPGVSAPESDPSTTHVADRLTSCGMDLIRVFDGSLWIMLESSPHQVCYSRSMFYVARDHARNAVDRTPLHAQSVQWQI